MEIALGVAVLVLAGAVVLLFAMFGELTARLPDLGARYRDPELRALDEARVGTVASSWPESLAAMASVEDRAVVVALSSACVSCEDVAAQLAEEVTIGRARGLGVVVSCADASSGKEFAERHGLWRLPCYVDEGGEWVTGNFGVSTSPAALIFERQRLQKAVLFNDLAALRAAAVELEEEVAA